MTVKKEKQDLRRFISIKKKETPSGSLKRQSEEIIRKVETDPDFVGASIVLAYWSLPDEVDIRSLIMKYEGQKQFILPVVNGEQLDLRYFEGISSLMEGPHFKIMEPKGRLFTEYKAIDLALVPGMAFDDMGFRLGRGGGYYDKLLPKLTSSVKVGLGFSFQKVDRIPSEPHDETVDRVIFP